MLIKSAADHLFLGPSATSGNVIVGQQQQQQPADAVETAESLLPGILNIDLPAQIAGTFLIIEIFCRRT